MNEGLGKRIDMATAISNKQFENVQGSFNNIEGSFNNIEGRFDNIEGRIKNVEEKIKNVEDNIKEKIELLSNRFDSKFGGEIGIKGKIEILNN
jgi:peptidoglycan hydrolase CwlO-like protein